MKHNISLAAVAVLAMIVSCSKENIAQQEEEYQDGPFEVTISGEMGEFAPTTKSTAEACIRMKWEEEDVVYAFGSDGSGIAYLGPLAVSIEEGNDYVAVLKGTLDSAPADENHTLYLVHSPLLDAASAPSSGYYYSFSVDMSTQSADVTPFVAYAVVKGVTPNDKYATTGLKTKFSFATSVLKVNATDIPENAELTSATISNIETVCNLRMNGGAFYIKGMTSGAITKALSGTASLSRASFYVGAPSFSAGTERTLTVVAGGKNYIEEDVMQTAYAENNYINYIYDVDTLSYSQYNDGTDRGVGTYIAATGVIWAPVNCGYASDTYGLLYQWGRKYGQAHESGTISPEVLTKEQGESSSYSDKFGEPHGTYGNWFYIGGKELLDNTLWNGSSKGTYDPCPEGWRVPTYYELSALIGNKSSWTTNTGQKGYWFSGGITYSETVSRVFLPAAGYRQKDNGVVNDFNETAYYWSSTVNDEVARTLSFSDTSCGIDGSFPCANGFSVRCVQVE